MYIQELLRERAASARPVQVALIGAGKFGSMFLAQAPSTAGLEVGVIADSRSRPRPRRVPRHALERRPRLPHPLHRRCVRRDTRRRCRRGGGGDRQPRGRHRPRPRRLRRGQAHRDGERRGRRARRAAAGGRGARRGGRLHHGLRRPARADLRDGGVGAGERLRRGGGGKGARSTCLRTTARRPTRCGTTTDSPRSRRGPRA